MTKLSDIQLILLSHAVTRDDGSLLPPPETLGDQTTRIRRAILPLIKQALVAEVETAEVDHIWREEGKQRFGLFITAAGRAAIGGGADHQDRNRARHASARRQCDAAGDHRRHSEDPFS